MIEEFGFILIMSVISVSLYLFMPLWAHLVTLRGLGRKALPDDKPTSFSIADGMILIALMAFATSLGTNAPIDQYRQNWVMIVSLNLFVVLMWHKCNKLMHKNEISDTVSKTVMQLFTYPSSILSLALFLVCGLLVIIGVIASFVPDYNDPVVRTLPYNFIALLIACGWIFLTRISFIRILNRTRPSK